MINYRYYLNGVSDTTGERDSYSLLKRHATWHQAAGNTTHPIYVLIALQHLQVSTMHHVPVLTIVFPCARSFERRIFLLDIVFRRVKMIHFTSWVDLR